MENKSIIDNSKRFTDLEWRPSLWEFPDCCFNCGEFNLQHPNNHDAFPLRRDIRNRRCCSNCNVKVERKRKERGNWNNINDFPY